MQVVNALKALQRSLVYGEEVSRLLQASPVWSQYEQQRHDLFIQVSNLYSGEKPPRHIVQVSLLFPTLFLVSSLLTSSFLYIIILTSSVRRLEYFVRSFLIISIN
jgi:hypothetical protein